MLMFRSTHEALLAAALADRDHWRLQAEAATERELATLREAVAEARKASAPPVIVPRVKREPDAVDGAIEWRAQGDVPVRRHLERWAKAERAKGREVAAIADDIMRGSSTDGTDDDGVPG